MFAGVEANYKLVFPWWFLYQFRDTSFDDVSIIFHEYLQKENCAFDYNILSEMIAQSKIWSPTRERAI